MRRLSEKVTILIFNYYYMKNFSRRSLLFLKYNEDIYDSTYTEYRKQLKQGKAELLGVEQVDNVRQFTSFL